MALRRPRAQARPAAAIRAGARRSRGPPGRCPRRRAACGSRRSAISRGSGSRWTPATRSSSRSAADRVVPIVAALLETERQRGFMAEELASRYQEIDLLYAISEILGQTVRLEEATRTIVREVSTVVGREAGVHHGVRRRRGRAPHRGRAGLRRGGPRAGAAWTTTARWPRRCTASSAPSSTTPRRSDDAPRRLRRRPGLQGPGLPERADLLWRAGLPAALHRRHQPHRPDRRRPLHARATGSWSPPSPTRSAPRWRTRGWSSAISASSGSGASWSWRTTSSSSCSRRPRCCTATRRWPRDACRRSRWAATSTPSPAWAAAGSA